MSAQNLVQIGEKQLCSLALTKEKI